MNDVSNERLQEFIDFYKQLGVDSEQFFVEENIVNIFDFLNIIPRTDENGNRILTSYEVLGVLPHIENGKEKPIIFFLKNKFRGLKITKPKTNFEFLYSKEANKKEESLIDIVLRNYKLAIVQNNLAEAERQYNMLNKITGGRAKHYVGAIYDYTKFYKQMKKQLLIDIFSHFFIVYLLRKKSLIKKGLIIKNKKFKAYESYKNQQSKIKNSEAIETIKSITIDSVSTEQDKEEIKIDSVEIDFQKELQDYTKNKNSKPLNQMVEKNIKSDIVKKSFLKKKKNKLFRKKRVFKKTEAIDKFDIHKEKIIKKTEKEVSYE